MELHDFYPQKKYRAFIKRLFSLWICVWIGDGVFNALYPWDSITWAFYSWGFFCLLLILPLGLILFIDFAKVLTLWDNFDYSMLTKTDFEFVTHEGLRLFAYLYTRKDIDIDKDPNPHPVIIGIHGINSHHREMDRYCLPSVIQNGYLYFTFDAQGHGQSPGNVNSLNQFEEVASFINKIRDLPYVDKKRICVVGMSMGANKVAVVAYPHPDVKCVVMLSGPYDFALTVQKMGRFERFGFLFTKLKLSVDKQSMQKYCGIHYFKPEGIILRDQLKPTSNNDRVFLAAALDDFTVHSDNTKNAIVKLNLSPENYVLFPKGAHNFTGNEWILAVKIFNFIQNHL